MQPSGPYFMRVVFTFLLSLLFTIPMFGQVGEIKSASAGNSSRGGGGRERGSSGAGTSYFFINLIGNGIIEWQQYKLSRKEINPSVVSFETMLQAAVQPSSYYVFNPRVRGNWGLFSTDFRINYLLQEDINGYEDLTTYDWQIVQMNLVTTRHVIGRVGIGFMHEDFAEHQSFTETTVGLNIYSNKRIINGGMEYRYASDFRTGAIPRREYSVFAEKQILQRGRLHGYVTFGGMYQRYYSSISVWGIQGGLTFKIQ